MNLEQIVKRVIKNQQSEGGLTIFEKNLLIESMSKKLMAVSSFLAYEAQSASKEDIVKGLNEILDRED